MKVLITSIVTSILFFLFFFAVGQSFYKENIYLGVRECVNVMYGMADCKRKIITSFYIPKSALISL